MYCNLLLENFNDWKLLCGKNHFLQNESLPPPPTTIKKKWKEKIKAEIYCYTIFLLTLRNSEKISSVRALLHGVIHWLHTKNLLSMNEWMGIKLLRHMLLIDWHSTLKIFPFPIFVYLLFYYIYNGLVYSYFIQCCVLW